MAYLWGIVVFAVLAALYVRQSNQRPNHLPVYYGDLLVAAGVLSALLFYNQLAGGG